MSGIFGQINDALTGKPPSGGGSTNKAGYTKFDSSPRDNIMAKLKTLGLDAMPEGGQEELDRQWGEYQSKQGKTAAMLKAGRGR